MFAIVKWVTTNFGEISRAIFVTIRALLYKPPLCKIFARETRGISFMFLGAWYKECLLKDQRYFKPFMFIETYFNLISQKSKVCCKSLLSYDHLPSYVLPLVDIVKDIPLFLYKGKYAQLCQNFVQWRKKWCHYSLIPCY